ncbi:MAG: sialidase family protein [Planctomycetaceae bacterium]
MADVSRRQFLGAVAQGATVTVLVPQVFSQSTPQSLIESIEKVTLHQNRDGKSETWFHPRACVVPGKSGPTVLMTRQWIRGSDYFGPVEYVESNDLGKTWSKALSIEPLGREPVDGHPGLMAGVCDVVPQYHAPTKTVLALGHVVFYRGPRFAKGDQLARYPVYLVRKPDGTWSPRRILEWDDPRGGFIYSNNCGQRVVMPNGDIMMSFTFGPKSQHRMVAGVRCSFNGLELKVKEVGPPLELNAGRGLLEPSVTRCNDRFFMTIRAEDGHGYVAASDGGLKYGRKVQWAWDDGTPIEMSTTQQHWLPHSDGLFLVYTRKDVSNTNVIRWRSPLWIAQVDPQRLCLIRDTERVVLPIVGDGVSQPDDVALMGNFNVTNVSPDESWVTVGEWLPRRNAAGNLLLGRIRWSTANSRVR